MSLSSQNSTGVRPRVALLGRFTESASALRFRGVVSARMLLEGLWAAGLDPVTLLPTADSSDWHERLIGFDGVLFAGGGDISPAAYGELPDSEHLYDIDDVQDANDLALMKYVLAEGIPFLALCRGMHLLNVALGGTLNQHIEPPHRQRHRVLDSIDRGQRDLRQAGAHHPHPHSAQADRLFPHRSLWHQRAALADLRRALPCLLPAAVQLQRLQLRRAAVRSGSPQAPLRQRHLRPRRRELRLRLQLHVNRHGPRSQDGLQLGP